MKRRMLLVLCMLAALLLLSACAGEKNNVPLFPEVTQNLGPAPVVTQAPVAVQPQEPAAAQGGDSIFAANPYDVMPEMSFTEADALGEENYIDPYTEEETVFFAQPDGTVYPYAGSTPIPLDPVDMPSPTPRAPISFNYGSYTASSVGVTFEGPTNWQVDESQPQTFVLTEPELQVNDGQPGTIIITAEPVTGNYDQSDLESHVKQRLDMLSAGDFIEWKPSYTATRHLMGGKGVYANYSGEMYNGVEVGGRIHYVCIDRVLYGVEIVYPLAYKDDYLNIFTKVRETIERN